MKKRVAILTLATALFVLPSLAQAYGLSSVREGFRDLHDDVVWPVEGTNISDVSSTFGPRVHSNRYDFHRGIDIPAAEGTDVYSVLDGEVYRIDDDDMKVTIEHTFTQPVEFRGHALTHFYTRYLHLSDVAGIEEGQTIFAGEKIGEVGDTDANTHHLHLDLRVGSWCSLEYQLDNETSSCAIGFDPHMHPMLLFDVPEKDRTLTLLQAPSASENGLVRFSSDDEDPQVNQITVITFDLARRQMVQKHVLDYSARLGFDASSTEELDTQNQSLPYIEPIDFGSAATFSTDIVIPTGFIPTGSSLRTWIVVSDIWNRHTWIKW